METQKIDFIKKIDTLISEAHADSKNAVGVMADFSELIELAIKNISIADGEYKQIYYKIILPSTLQVLREYAQKTLKKIENISVETVIKFEELKKNILAKKGDEKMNTTEILNRLTTDFDGTEITTITLKLDKLADEMYDALTKKMGFEQKKAFNDLYDIMSDLANFKFKDGILYGMKLATQIKKLLKNPDKYFMALSFEDKPILDCHIKKKENYLKSQKDNLSTTAE